jgi:phage shock protein C
MSRSSWEHGHRHGCGSAGGLYRDRENGWIFGVCAGFADYANLRTGTVRIIAVACLILFFWATVIAYLAATLLLKTKPLTWSGRCEEYEFWRRRTTDDGWRHS